MMGEIMDSCDLPEGSIEEALTATEESQSESKMEFFVQMRSFTQRDMETFIVEAAARQIVGRSADSKLAKEIEQRCAVLTAERADKVLSGVTAEIMDQPMTPSFGDKKPVTMREFLSLFGREYLAATVDRHDGKPATGYGSLPRMEYLVSRYMDAKFKAEVEKATNAALVEIRAELKARHEAIIKAETARFREALAKTVAS
jgi:hypothetical protein